MREQQGASRIVSVGYYLPETRVRTAEMLEAAGASRFGVTNNFIEDTMGIREVRHAASDQRPSDLAVAAAEQALAKTDINPDEIDLIIFCGIEGDYAEPSTAHIVQAALGLSGICFDVSNACLGFMSGVQIANDMIKAGSIRYALVCTGEKPSKISHRAISALQHDRSTRDFFWKTVGSLTVGDAGGAAIIGCKTSKSCIMRINTTSDGKLYKLCYYGHDKDGITHGEMSMREISRAIAEAHKSLYPTSLSNMRLSPSNIHCLITHQVGKRPWERFSQILGVAKKKMTKTFENYGNITSATFAVNYAKAQEEDRIQEGDCVFAAMAGSGLSVCQAGIIV